MCRLYGAPATYQDPRRQDADQSLDWYQAGHLTPMSLLIVSVIIISDKEGNEDNTKGDKEEREEYREKVEDAGKALHAPSKAANSVQNTSTPAQTSGHGGMKFYKAKQLYVGGILTPGLISGFGAYSKNRTCPLRTHHDDLGLRPSIS